MKKVFIFLTLIFCFSLLSISSVTAEGKKTTTSSGLTVVYQAKFPITLQTGEYELQSIIADLAPGTGVPEHMHGGHVLVTVLRGQVVLKEKGSERTIKVGENWTENPGDLHSVVNTGKTKARVAITILLPKGAEATTIKK